MLARLSLLAPLILFGCASAHEIGRAASVAVVEESARLFAEHKDELTTIAVNVGTQAAERIAGRAESFIDAKASEARAKQAAGEPLDATDRLWIALGFVASVLAPLAVAGGKAALRFSRNNPRPEEVK